MFISMCLANGSMAEHPQGTESQKVKGLTGKKTGGKKKMYMDTTEVFTSKMTITIFLNMATVA